jgi:hypothetical protein
MRRVLGPAPARELLLGLRRKKEGEEKEKKRKKRKRKRKGEKENGKKISNLKIFKEKNKR